MENTIIKIKPFHYFFPLLNLDKYTEIVVG
jgi:hypothetical protein